MKKKPFRFSSVVIPLIIVVKAVIFISGALIGGLQSGGLPQAMSVGSAIKIYIAVAVIELVMFFLIWQIFKKDPPNKP